MFANEYLDLLLAGVPVIVDEALLPLTVSTLVGTAAALLESKRRFFFEIVFYFCLSVHSVAENLARLIASAAVNCGWSTNNFAALSVLGDGFRPVIFFDVAAAVKVAYYYHYQV